MLLAHAAAGEQMQTDGVEHQEMLLAQAASLK